MKYSLITTLLLSVSSLYAIEYSHTSVKAALSFPIGSFSDNSTFEDGGFAGVGTGAVLQTVFTLGSPALLAVADVMILYHPFKGDMLKNTEPFDSQGLSSVEGGAYLLMPFLFGPGVRGDLFNSASLYSTVQIGFNISLQSSLRGSGTTTFDTEFDASGPGTAFAFSGGIIVHERFDFVVRYINLGRPELFYEPPFTADTEHLSGRRMFYIKTVQILAGITF